MEATPIPEVKATLARVAAKRSEWHALPTADKLALARQVLPLIEEHTEEWMVAATTAVKADPTDIQRQGHTMSTSLLKGPMVLAAILNGVIETLEAIVRTGKPPPPLASRKTADGNTAFKVFPYTTMDSIAFMGFQHELICEPTTDGEVQYASPPDEAGLCLVLGAGNYEGPNDIIDRLFLHNQVVVYKSNPVNSLSQPVLAKILKPLTDAGFLGVVHGGVEVGSTLVDSSEVASILLTGSYRTYDAIKWGPGSVREANKAKNTPMTDKPIHAELGSVNPYIIVPGNWSDSEIDTHAQQLAATKMFNNGHICASPQIVITCKQWPLREKFLARLDEHLRNHPATPAYYPACDKSYAQHLSNTGSTVAETKHPLYADQQSCLFVKDYDKDNKFALQNEAFCPVLAEVALDTAPETDPFIVAASDYARQNAWGSLTITVIANKAAMASPVFKSTVDKMEFGLVAVNVPTLFGLAFPKLSWGGYPRHTEKDIGSGMGKIGNTALLKRPIKSFMQAPFTYPPSQTQVPSPAAELAKSRHFVRYITYPTVYRLVRLIVNAVTGF